MAFGKIWGSSWGWDLIYGMDDYKISNCGYLIGFVVFSVFVGLGGLGGSWLLLVLGVGGSVVLPARKSQSRSLRTGLLFSICT